MSKQSNIEFDLELTRHSIKKETLTKTKNQSIEKNYICQRYATRHGLIVATTKQSQLKNESKVFTSSSQPKKFARQIQETNINTTIIDILEKSSDDCPLTETSLKERLDQYFNKDNQRLIINERLLGEICYQLERHILVIIFSKSKQLYGYSLRYLSSIIQNESHKCDRSIHRKRFLQIEKYLSKTNFRFNYHSILTFYFINKYGIYSDYQWLKVYSNILSNLNDLKSFCYSILSNHFHEDLSIIIDSLELISNFDHKPLFFCTTFPHHLNLEQQGRASTTETYIYRHRLVTRSTTASSITGNNYDFYSASTLTSFLNYYQPSPTFGNELLPLNQTENGCPRQKNVHRNCQRSCQGLNQNTNCRHQKICICDHNCGFSCLSRTIVTERYLCPIMNNPPHGRIHYDGHSFYSRLVYECNAGYTLLGPKERICVSDGFWEPVVDVYCIRKDEVCIMDISITNGDYTPKQQVYYPDQQIRIECNPGCELDRLSPALTCLKNGTWSPIETPRCLKSPCGEPPSIPNAYLVNATSTYAQYACFERYVLKDSLSQIECKQGRWQNIRPQCIEARCQHPTLDGFNGYVLNSRSIFPSGEGTGLTCNNTHSTHYDLIPMIDYIVCDNQGIWKPMLPKCYAKCRLPDLGKNTIGYYIDDNTNDWYGKELQTGAYIRHGYSIKYLCQCQSTSVYNCSLVQPAFVQCIDGEWTNGGPHCRERISGKCRIPFDTPYVLLNNNTSINTILSEGESFDYGCIDGYARMTNVTCTQGNLTPKPLCEPKNCTTHPYWIKNGYVKYHNRRHGGHAEYSCRNGYKLSNQRILRCLFGKWESPYDRDNLVQCVADICLHPGVIRNGKIFVVNYGTSRYILSVNVSLSHGASLQFECDPSFMLVGNRGSTCFSGKWRPEQLPICNEGYWIRDLSFCPRKREVARQRQCFKSCFDDSDCRSRYRSCVCDYDCGMSCVKRGISCPFLTPPEHGHITYSNGNKFSSRAAYECHAGYVLEGSKYRYCQGDMWWGPSDVIPYCAKEVFCDRPPDIINAVNDVPSTITTFHAGYSIKYTCLTGYVGTGTTISECTFLGQWTFSTLKCTPIDCDSPGILRNGFLSGERFDYPNIIAFFCNDGYELIGKDTTRACQENGLWSGSMPVCQKKTCGALPLVPHSEVIQPDRTTNETIQYICQDGYQLNGSSILKCISSQWQPAPPSCEPIICEDPQSYFNGHIELISINSSLKYLLDSVITFQCPSNLILRGSRISKCQINGTWLPNIPTCEEPVSCSIPPLPQNARYINLHSFKRKINDGSHLEYICENSQYRQKIVCRQGKMVPQKLMCYNDCHVNNENIQFSKTFYRHREKIAYTCPNNTLALSINETIRCINGNLSKQPICQSIQCTVPHMLFLRNIINTTIPSGTLFELGTSFVYTCSEDYQPIIESARVECSDDGKLSHQPHCVPRQCKEHPPIITNGRTIFQSTRHGSIAKYRCFPGYRIDNNHLSKVTCQFGQWLPKQPPKCLPVFCTNPGPLINGRIFVVLKDERVSTVPIRSEFRSYIPNVGHGRTIEFECNMGYVLHGPSGLTCNHGRWMPSERPRCIFENHAHPDIIFTG
ncbi:unnamed protein product [Rotaria socialis]|uniref:Sushi domain-containing protein n=1 Tax=Rotaria socialis TaxID=392032 RepID=A0A820C1H8_9BILA|nr:unnamed protein product [Rotaria socialis]